MNFESLKIKEEIEQQKREAEKQKREAEKLASLFTVEGMKQFNITITKEQEQKIRKWVKE